MQNMEEIPILSSTGTLGILAILFHFENHLGCSTNASTRLNPAIEFVLLKVQC